MGIVQGQPTVAELFFQICSVPFLGISPPLFFHGGRLIPEVKLLF